MEQNSSAGARQERPDILTFLASTASAMLEHPLEKIDEAVHEALARFGLLVEADRVAVLQRSAETSRLLMTYEWCREGVAEHKAACRDIPDSLPMMALLLRNKPEVVTTAVTSMPDTPMKQLFATQGVEHIVMLQLRSHQEPIGIIFLEFMRPVESTPELTGKALPVFAQLTTSVLARKKDAELLANKKMALSGGRVGTWELDLRTETYTWDDVMYSIYGRKPEEFSGQFSDWLPMLHPDERAWMVAALETAQMGSMDRGYIFRIVLPGGEVRHIRSTTTIISDSNGNPVRVVGTNTDITHEKLMESELEKANLENAHLQERLQIALDAAKTGVWDYDIRNNTLIWDDWMYRLYGITKENFSGAYDAWENGLHPDDLEDARNALHEAIAGGKPFSPVFRVVHPSGEIRHVQARATIMRDEAGEPLRAIGTNIDITERLLQEQEIRDKTDELEALYNGVTDGLLVGDIETKRLVACNSVIQEMTGKRADELLGHSIGVLPPPELKAELFGGFELQASGKQRVIESELLQKDGGRLPVSINASHITYKGRACLLGVFHDISDRRRYEEEIRENLRMKNDFISTVSHELRTPLFSILGFSSTLLRDQERLDVATREEFLGIINSESKRLGSLIEDVLTISRIDSNSSKYKPVALNAGDTIAEVMRTLRANSGEKGLEVQLEVAENAPEILFDRDALKQVLVNLIGNAVKFTPQGGTVRVKLFGERESVCIEVSDTGVGIPAEDLQKVFEKFYRSEHSASNAGGTGLGLAIVRELVELHDGTVSVSSVLNEGSTFRVLLPSANH